MKIQPKVSLAAILILLLTIPSAADDSLYGSSGFKMIFSEEENISQQYNKPFAILGWKSEIIDISASYYRWMSYAITDEFLNSRDIDINQSGANITICAGDLLSISGGYHYMTGTSSYKAHKAEGDLIFDLDSIDITFDTSIKNTGYDFDGPIKNTSIITGAEITFDITESYCWDLGYLYEYTDYETYGYIYTKNSGRTGIIAIPSDNFFFLSGFSAGRDSDNINSVCFDAGLTIRFLKHIKLSAAYILTAEFITSESETAAIGRRKSMTTSSASSTYTEFSQTGNISVTFYF